MSESSFVENPKPGKKPKRVNHLKMLVIDDLKADTILNTVKEHVNPQAELTTDDATSYSKLSEHVKSHHAQVIKKEDLPKILPWVHIAIGNVKRLLLDVHHQITNEYLQYYLNEFCYKFNRRYFGDAIFDRLLVAAVSYNSDFKSRIYNRNHCG
jgi:transposase-like protein